MSDIDKQIQEFDKALAAEIWARLSQIDVSEHTKAKGDIVFLPWAAAWQILMENYPESVFDCSRFLRLDNGTVEVWAMVKVVDGDRSFSREMWLPVMNYKHQAVNDPSSREISDARMRALVKCIALFGLGIHLYFGEDYPRLEPAKKAEAPPKIDDEQAANLVALIEEVGAEPYKFCAFFGIKTPEKLPASRFKEAIKMLEKRRAK